jgi:plastocyanin
MNTNLRSALAGRWLRRPASPRLIVAAVAFAFVAAACSTATGAPGYTYPPLASQPALSPASSPMSMGPSASAPPMSGAPGPSVPASAGPASASPGSTGGAAPVGTTAHISAQNILFDTDHLEAPASQGWVLVFANNDAGVPHNVEILDSQGASVFRGEVVTGPTTVSYQIPALPAGTYKFFCDVHPTMTGILTVSS